MSWKGWVGESLFSTHQGQATHTGPFLPCPSMCLAETSGNRHSSRALFLSVLLGIGDGRTKFSTTGPVGWPHHHHQGRVPSTSEPQPGGGGPHHKTCILLFLYQRGGSLGLSTPHPLPQQLLASLPNSHLFPVHGNTRTPLYHTGKCAVSSKATL